MLKLFLLSLLVAGVAIWYADREMGKEEYLLKDIEVISYSESVETHLTKYKSQIGPDFEGYKNHIYRVLTYTLHFLDGDKSFLPVIEAALVYHDIGLWTHSELSYLEPSSELGQKDTAKEFGPDERQLLHNIIYWHHKFTPFTGKHQKIVNAVRMADWIDATMGFITKGMPVAHIKKVTDAIPEAGFHQTLIDIGPRYHGWNYPKIIWELSGIMKL